MRKDLRTEELAKAKVLLEKEFGKDWQVVAQLLGTENLRTRVGKELTSFMAFPERGEGGDKKWRGNCAPQVIEAITKYVMDCKRYEGKSLDSFTLLDPMSGSGTSAAVAKSLGIKSVLYDLNPSPSAGRGGFNALTDEVDASADLIFVHPPYYTAIPYSGNMWGDKPDPNDLSRCTSWEEFTDKLNTVYKKLFFALRNGGRLAMLVGDIKLQGKFYSMADETMKMGEFESFIVKGQYNCVSDGRTYRKPFIPIVTEYMLVCKKNDPLVILFDKRLHGVFDTSKKDDKGLTWMHLIRATLESLGGKASLEALYARLQNHEKAKRNANWQARIRATLYENPNEFSRDGRGEFRLTYAA